MAFSTGQGEPWWIAMPLAALWWSLAGWGFVRCPWGARWACWSLRKPEISLVWSVFNHQHQSIFNENDRSRQEGGQDCFFWWQTALDWLKIHPQNILIVCLTQINQITWTFLKGYNHNSKNPCRIITGRPRVCDSLLVMPRKHTSYFKKEISPSDFLKKKKKKDRKESKLKQTALLA